MVQHGPLVLCAASGAAAAGGRVGGGAWSSSGRGPAMTVEVAVAYG